MIKLGSQNYLNPNFVPLQAPLNHGFTSVNVAPQPLPQPTWQSDPSIPHMVPAVVPFTPVVYNVFESVPQNADFWVLTPNGVERALPSQYCDSQNGNFVAPQGWSLMPREEFFNYQLNMIPFPTDVIPLSPSPPPSASSSRSQSVEPTAQVKVFAQANVKSEQSETPQKAGVKRAHRAKQVKIAEIHEKVKEYCENQGIFAEEKEVLRGEDVLRIHVKTWEGLDLIQVVIQEVEERVPIARIALPFSMKNKFQKKGFICYMKVEDVCYVPVVQEIFSNYSHAFKKCDVALPTNKPAPEKVDQVAKPVFIPPFSMAPPSMAKRSSAA